MKITFTKNNQDGFFHATVLVVLVFGLIGFTGYYLHKQIVNTGKDSQVQTIPMKSSVSSLSTGAISVGGLQPSSSGQSGSSKSSSKSDTSSAATNAQSSAPITAAPTNAQPSASSPSPSSLCPRGVSGSCNPSPSYPQDIKFLAAITSDTCPPDYSAPGDAGCSIVADGIKIQIEKGFTNTPFLGQVNNYPSGKSLKGRSVKVYAQQLSNTTASIASNAKYYVDFMTPVD